MTKIVSQLGLWVLIANMAIAKVAIAQVPTSVDVSSVVSLQWKAPAECPTKDAVMAAIASMMQEIPHDKRARVNAKVEVLKSELSYLLVLQTEQSGSHGARSFIEEHCSVAARAVAFMIALMINPDAKMSEEPIEFEPSPLETTQEAIQSSPLNDQLKRLQHGFISVGPALQVGVLPALSGGAAIEGGLELDVWQVALRALFVAPRKESIPTLTGAKAIFWNWQVGAQVGWMFRRGAWQGGPLIGIDIGQLRGRTRGVSEPSSNAKIWVEAHAGASLAYLLRKRFALVLQGETGVPWVRNNYNLEGDVAFNYRPDPWFVRFFITGRLYF